VEHVVQHALLHGYVHIDAAKIYANQNEVARGVKEAIKQRKGQLKRSDIWITSKLWNTHHEPSRAREQIDDILSELQVDYLDLLLIHWPVSWRWDGKTMLPDDRTPDTSHTVMDTWRVMESYVKSGKVRSIGVSNFSVEQVDEILAECEIKPVVNQVESHPYFSNSQLQHDMEQRGVCFEGYSPLGNISGNVDESPMAEPAIKQLAQKYNKSPAQVIIRWHLQSNRIVIPKSSRPERAVENSQIFDFALTASEMRHIDALDRGEAGRQSNPAFYPNKRQVFATNTKPKL